MANAPADDMRKAIIGSDFAVHLRRRFIMGGADTSRLLVALGSLVIHGEFILTVSRPQVTGRAKDPIEDIRSYIIAIIIQPLVEQIGKGNIFTTTFAYECIRPSLLDHREPSPGIFGLI